MESETKAQLPFIKTLQSGERTTVLAAVRTMNLRTGRTGNSYLDLLLEDKTGSIEAKVWDNADAVAQDLGAGDLVLADGEVGTYRDRPQFTIRKLTKKTWDAESRRNILVSSTLDMDQMWSDLLDLLDSIEDKHLRDFLIGLLTQSDIEAAFRSAPAAKMIHHAWVGGLMEHTLSMMRLAAFLSDHYRYLIPELNRSELMAGVLLHDLGKIQEFDLAKGGMEYSTRGRLVGHMTLVVELLERFAATHPLEQDQLDRLLHMVLSHHGDFDKGSPVLPRTPEAVVLHEIDMMDSQIVAMARALPGRKADGWTDWVRPLGKRYYVPPISNTKTQTTTEAPKQVPDPAPPTDDTEEAQQNRPTTLL